MSDRVTIQWLEKPAGIVRIHDTDQIPGPWCWSCTLEKIDKVTVKLHATVKAPTARQLKMLLRKARQIGIKKVIWIRAKKGKVEFDI